MRCLRLFLIVVICFASVQTGFADTYSTWKWDAKKKRHWCEYEYETNGKNQKQICIWYPEGEHKDYYYWVKDGKDKYWGRCLCPAAKTYNKKEMTWWKLQNNKWSALSAGDCPQPEAGANPIDNIPDPPK